MAIVFSASGLKPSVGARVTVGIAGETVAYGAAVYCVPETERWWQSDANGAAAKRVVHGLALNAAVVGQSLLVVQEDPHLRTGLTTGEVIAAGSILVLSTAPGVLKIGAAVSSSTAVVVAVANSSTEIHFKPLAGGETAAGTFYTRTAFVASGGSDSGGTLGYLDQPYLTLAAAVGALAAAYPGQTTTIRCLGGVGGDGVLSSSASLDTLLTAGLTIRSHDTGVVSLGEVSFGSQPDALLTLNHVSITALVKVGHVGGGADSAGTITGDAETVIGLLQVSGSGSYTPGGNGAHGGTVNADAGFSPPPNSPPMNGYDGDMAYASGAAGSVGSTGNRAWDVTLAGAGSVSYITAVGGPGGDGGIGGNGGSALGGFGGRGGDSNNSMAPEVGGNGGNGGNAYANGGAGGTGGRGGDGGDIDLGAWAGSAIASYAGGAGGISGTPGSAGTATAGGLGLGGDGALGGANGTAGTAGTAYASAGASGGTNGSGTAGSLV
jgi:hypothetical protein